MINLEKKLRKENNAQDKQLTKENNLILTDMIVYLHSTNLCEYDIEIIRKELIGMAMEAQLRKDDFKTFVGDDYKLFCDELIKNGRQKTRYEKALETLYILVFGVGALMLYEVFLYVMKVFIKKEPTNAILMMPITWGFLVSIVSGVIMAYGTYTFISKKSFELTTIKKYKYLFGGAFGMGFTGILFSRVYLSKFTFCSVNFIYPTIFVILACIIVKLMSDRNLNHLARTHK